MWRFDITHPRGIQQESEKLFTRLFNFTVELHLPESRKSNGTLVTYAYSLPIPNSISLDFYIDIFNREIRAYIQRFVGRADSRKLLPPISLRKLLLLLFLFFQ